MKGPLAQLGRYHVIDRIASGGMASVYRARMETVEGFSKIVALKIMHPHLAEDEEHVAMFLDEGRLCARLTHPNLVSVFDFGSIDGYRFMAMEFYDGLSLSALTRHLRRSQKSIGLGWSLAILREVLAGLDHAHNLQDESGRPLSIVHRDISPENILVTTQGEVKIIDFGIALDNERRCVSRTGIVKGKVGYMSPEQAGGRTLDRRTDIYAVGVMGYELITGQSLFGEGTTQELRQRIARAGDAVVKPGALPHPDVEDAIVRALKRDPNDRHATAGQFAGRIDTVLEELEWSHDRASLGALVKDAAADVLGERKAREARKRREEARRNPQKPVAIRAPARKRKRAPRNATSISSPAGGWAIDVAARWAANTALALFGIGVLMELFGVSFPVP